MPSQSSTQEMIKELKEVRSVFNQCEKTDDTPYSRDLENQARLDLAISLQVSLEIEGVVNRFMEHIHSYLLFDGFSYQCQGQITDLGATANIEYARQQGHNCTYNLEIENTPLGSLCLFRGRRFTESELVLLENFLTILVYPLRNAIAYKQATLLAHCDALTGVKNRSTFDETLIREIQLSHRHEQDLTLLVVDIDHFKKVNDTYGHSVGDQALKAVADTISDCIRSTDMLFRYGGEEFAVLLSNADCEKSYVIADRILQSVRDIEMSVMQDKLKLTVSIGLTCLNVQDNSQSMFTRADQAMYAAKHKGRDRLKFV